MILHTCGKFCLTKYIVWKLYRNYREINSLQKYFLNPVYCALFMKGNVRLRDGYCPYTFQNFVGGCIYRICSNRTWGKYEYGTILQLIIQLIHLKVCSFIYRICSNGTWRKYEYVTILQLIHFTVCNCVYRTCSNRMWGKYEYGTILHLIIQLINFKVCSCIYRTCSNGTWGKYEYGTILQLIYFTVCNCIHRICSNRTWRKYEYGTILQLINVYSDGQIQNDVQYKNSHTSKYNYSYDYNYNLLILCYSFWYIQYYGIHTTYNLQLKLNIYINAAAIQVLESTSCMCTIHN